MHTVSKKARDGPGALTSQKQKVGLGSGDRGEMP